MIEPVTCTISESRDLELQRAYSSMNESTAFFKSLPKRKEPSSVSVALYQTLFDRMIKVKQTPIQYAQSRSYFYTCRAAWCYCLEKRISEYADLIKKEKDRDQKIKFIKSYCKMVDYLRDCPPDSQHKHLKMSENGEYVSDWRQAKKPSRKSKSKKGQKLPNDWQQTFFDYLHTTNSKLIDQSSYLPAVCCLKLFGVRPRELVSGVVVRRKGDMLHIIVKSAKTHGGKYGQDIRSFSVKSECPYFNHLSSLINDDVDLVVKISSAKNLCEQLRKFNDRLFPKLTSKISAYTFRHNFLAMAKGVLTSEGVAVVAGHSNDLSQSYYSNRKPSDGSFLIDNINGTKQVKQVVKSNLSHVLDASHSLKM